MKSLIHFSISIVISLLITTTYNVAQNCEVPDNGTGTITLPPIGCQYTSLDGVFLIVDGLPPGTTIELEPLYHSFVCCDPPCQQCLLPLAPGECETNGGNLGGKGHCFTGMMEFVVTGTGQLAGFNRVLSLEIFSEVHTGPRNPGFDIQEFNTVIESFSGEFYGDPDFDSFIIIAGNNNGLPSPGETKLKKLQNGNFTVDSFFDITYEIEFEGAPGSPLDGLAGTSLGTLRMQTPSTANDSIVPGIEFWTVPESPASFVEIGGEVPAIPADFFGPGSDPFTGAITFKGKYLDSPDPFFPDAHIRRESQAYLPEPYTSSDNIDIEIIELYLVDITPITVTYTGGQNPELWNVELELSSIFPQDLGNMDISKNDASGGEFIYAPLSIYPTLIFTKISDPGMVVDWPDVETGMVPLSYTTTAPYPWEHSPIGSDFNPVGTSTMQLFSAGGSCELYFNPYLLRQDDFWVEVNPEGEVITGGGSGFNDGEWYYYPNFDWWNIWFYDHPYSVERDKAISVSFTVDRLDPSLDGYANIVFNWSTGAWSEQGVPGQPPLPQDVPTTALETTYIMRSDPIFIGSLDGPIFINEYFYEILEYNPEWISMDIEGYNFTILDGTINHVCWEPDNSSEIDWGDAPDPTYPTYAANNGAHHFIDGITFLGNIVDGEPDGQPDPNALGDDNNGGPDEDGVFFTSQIIPGQIATVDILASIDGFLNLWVDFDINGSWAETDDWVYNDILINAGLNSYSFLVPASALPGVSFARFRFCSDNGMAQSYEGGAANGEVEDYEIFIEQEQAEEMDYGDAIDPSYPTLLASDGARHLIDGITFLGSDIDPEFNGQPDPNALGDDNDGNDDEDGVIFTSQLIRGSITTLDVVVTVDGYLDAWLDFNTNNNWEAGEVIFTSEPLVAGINNLSFIIPSAAIPGLTYVRFRFSSYGGLLITGLATDGEVEDYEVEIEEVPNKWVQYPNPELPGLHAHDWDSQPAYGQIILADDWICQGGWVTDIHWWGNYESDPTGDEIRGAGIEYFHLSIHILDTSTYCKPLDPEIWGVDIPFSALNEIPTGLINLEGCPIYMYEYLIEKPFPQVESKHYWLDITAVCTDPINPAQWRWQESQRTYPPIICAAVEKTLPNPGIWNSIDWANETKSDMAFMITSGIAPELDLGDANDPTYPTLLINNGAAHIIDPTIYLGNAIDAEPDGQPTTNSKGDDNNGVPNDEDGVLFNPIGIGPFIPGGTAHLDITASIDGFINAWIDYNGNGSWADANEQILFDYAVVAGSNWIFISVPTNANIGSTSTRFRFDTVGGLSYTGIAQDGEVEDYEIFVEGDLDFGDAPDQAFPAYPTLLASDGARHIIDPNVYLGNSIDNESDGQQNMTATGDDNDGNNDEDGVLIPFMLGHGQMTTITVIASVDGFLNGWIDFNSSGNWIEADEHIFIDQPLLAGNNTLIINIPTTSVKGTSYARFRFSTSPGLSYIGQAPDGEVEDYEVEIGNPEKWLQYPDLSIFGMDIDATFKSDSPESQMILADDFECTVTGPLTRIEIWGSWLNDVYPYYVDPGAVRFTLSIHKDIPAEESATGYSMPGEVLWYRTFDPIEFMFELIAMEILEGWYNPSIPWYIFPGDTECWKYIFPLAENEFIQKGTADEPKVYWLDIQAEPLDPEPICRFGWKTSIDHWNDNAVWGIGSEPYPGPWEELIYPPEHELQGQAIDMAFAIYGDESPYLLLDLTVLLEGPWDGTSMGTSINNANLLPLNQPYSIDPMAKWYYTGTESVVAIPNPDIVDWVMVELRDASSPAMADGNEMIDQKAAFVLKDGSVVAVDGFSKLKSYANITHNPYIVIWHRNHLGIISNNPLNLMGVGVYSYSFTTGPSQAYLNGQMNLGGTIYGMFGGDANPDGSISNSDKLIWEVEAGTTGYKVSDFNLDTQIDNKDKDDIWVPNLGEGTKVPN